MAGIFRGVAATRAAEQHVLERNLRRLDEFVRVHGIESTKIGLRRLGKIGGVLDHELELLREPAPDDRIVLAQAKLARLSRQQLFADQVGDEPAHFAGRRRPLPLPRPCLAQPAKLARTDAQLTVRPGRSGIRIPPRVQREHCGASQREVKERLAKKHSRQASLSSAVHVCASSTPAGQTGMHLHKTRRCIAGQWQPESAPVRFRRRPQKPGTGTGFQKRVPVPGFQ